LIFLKQFSNLFFTFPISPKLPAADQPRLTVDQQKAPQHQKPQITSRFSIYSFVVRVNPVVSRG